MSKVNVSLIIKEVLMCIIAIIFALLINLIIFKAFFVRDITVGTAGSYAPIQESNYTVVNGTLQDRQDPTETYAASPSELETYQSEYRYEIGTINPFVSSDAVNDLPQETVGAGGEVAQ